ncbi:mechanosensitive ion channel family protein [Stutzerimonas zhaodongensis]|uniref:Mechanosensitive ion channel family protein n=1 Tax=Stutzerimonas zhaodongensis TaxID=1176257 RepID=A0A3M2HMP8_9GAMM|nr:mechanosensitive ion channel family protein [Stutzerimonas zhaodongensis]
MNFAQLWSVIHATLEWSSLIDILETPFHWEQYITEPALRVLLAATVVVVLLSVFSRVLTAVMLRLGRGFLFTKAVSEQLEKPIRVLLPLLGLQAVLATASSDLALIGISRRITTLLIIGCFTWLAMRLLRGLEQAVRLKNPVDVTDNLRARQIQTQSRVLLRTMGFFVLLIGAAGMLMTFPAARQFGASLLASAGLAGLAVGFAARPVLGNLIAGIQIAITQPIRLDDVVIVENEWGRIEEITGTYVVVRIWDDRRLVVPLQYFIEKPFQNWTRRNSSIIGSIFLWVDYSLPLEPVREELRRLCGEVPELWDGRVIVLQVTDTSEKSIQLRVLVSSPDSSRNWDLRCHLRESLIGFIQRQYPQSLPQLRADLSVGHKPRVDHSVPDHIEPERQPPV